MTSELEIASNELEAALNDYLDAMPDEDIANEYVRITTFEERVKQSKATISSSINNSSTTVLVNLLPVEVLTRIFRLVSESEPCRMWPRSMYTPHQKFSKYPVLFTHVCAFWRHIVIHTPLFWSHIDITPELYSNERLWNRTQVFVTRSCDSTLDIHIATCYPTDEYWEAGGLNKFLAPLVPRMRSLDFQMKMEYTPFYDAEPSIREFCSSILSNCFGVNCVPGTLTRVSLDVDTECPFIEASENMHQGDHIALDTPAHHLAEIWRRVIILSLEDVFPFWTSAAYSGLIELTLGVNNRSESGKSISEHHLVKILSSSPQLRTLDLGLQVVPASNLSMAIVLPNLEILTLRPNSTSNLENITRLLAPGPKPLHLTLYSTVEDPNERYITTTQTVKLLARSNITTIHFVNAESYSKLLNSVDTLQTLAFTIYSEHDITTTLPLSKPPNLQVERLRILCGYHIELSNLLRLIRVYAPRHLLFWCSSTITRDGRPIKCNIAQIEKELATPGTSIKIILSELPDPTEYPFITL